MELGNTSNKRKYFRIECTTPICSEVTITRINNQSVRTGSSRVCVEDIGPGGLKFVSNLDLPINPNLIIKFHIDILNNPVIIEGFIVRRSKLKNNIYQYGVSFAIQDTEVKLLWRLLNDLEYATRKGGVKNKGSSFCSKSKLECFKLEKIDREKRASLRFQCPSPLCAKLIVKKINNKTINSDSDRVCVEEIGQGGLRFLSHIDYPVISDILYEFQIIIFNQKLILKGYIVRKNEIENKVYQYGVKFDILDFEKEEVSEAIDTMKKEINMRLGIKRSSFCIRDKVECLRSRDVS
jgi:hypothetical protein